MEGIEAAKRVQKIAISIRTRIKAAPDSDQLNALSSQSKNLPLRYAMLIKIMRATFEVALNGVNYL